jgi:hypothetical protein
MNVSIYHIYYLFDFSSMFVFLPYVTLLFAEFDINIGNQNDVSLDSGIDVADLGGIGSKKINISPLFFFFFFSKQIRKGEH